MTFCIGIRVQAGLVLLCDTRVVRGAEVSRKSKLTMVPIGRGEIALTTSGLRSVRDKVVARLDDRLRVEHGQQRIHEVATMYGSALREVRDEDGSALSRSGLSFNPHALVAGRLELDGDPVLMHVYPEGNWVEATDDAPYFIIGRSSFGKPILDRLLSADSTMRQAVSLAYLAFDATRASATDVDFPIDVAVLHRDESRFASIRFEDDQLARTRAEWHDRLRGAFHALSSEWADPLLRPPNETPT